MFHFSTNFSHTSNHSNYLHTQFRYVTSVTNRYVEFKSIEYRIKMNYIKMVKDNNVNQFYEGMYGRRCVTHSPYRPYRLPIDFLLRLLFSIIFIFPHTAHTLLYRLTHHLPLWQVIPYPYCSIFQFRSISIHIPVHTRILYI